jgi:hypothetical protein
MASLELVQKGGLAITIPRKIQELENIRKLKNWNCFME